jgi:hypothetical protein
LFRICCKGVDVSCFHLLGVFQCTTSPPESLGHRCGAFQILTFLLSVLLFLQVKIVRAIVDEGNNGSGLDQ